MKSLILVTLIALTPAFATAQNTTKPAQKKTSQASPRPASKGSAKPSAAKSSKSVPSSKRRASNKSASLNDASERDELRSLAGQLAAGTRAADRALTPTELEVAGRVQTGRMPCELGNVVDLSPDPRSPGHFELALQKLRFRMSPVETKTGAIRLEDQQAGVVWLQLANKSMLMNQKIGQRLADDCQSPAQLQVADAMKRMPARGLFDDAAPAAAAQR